MEMAQSWSDWNSRSVATKFDAERAARDPQYLTAYTQAFVLSNNSDPNYHHFDDSDELRHYLVEEIEYFDPEEYDARYANAE